MKHLTFFYIGLISIIPFLTMAQNIDVAKSEVKFKIKNFGGWVNGSLPSPNATISWNEAKPAAFSIKASIAVEGIKTGIGARDKHLLKDDYFYSHKYPTISFKATGATKSGNGWKAKGTLSIKGVDKEIEIPFTVKSADGIRYFEGSFSIDRRDFGVGDSSFVLGDEVIVSFKLYEER